MTPVTGQPAADTTAGPGPHQLASVSLGLACGFPAAGLWPLWPLCGNTATHNPTLPTMASWWPCPGLSTCLEHRYAGPALQGFSCPTVATLDSIGQSRPPWPVCRTPRQPPRGVKATPGTMRKPQRFRQQKTPPASFRLSPGQLLASTSETQASRNKSELGKRLRKKRGVAL